MPAGCHPTGYKHTSEALSFKERTAISSIQTLLHTALIVIGRDIVVTNHNQNIQCELVAVEYVMSEGRQPLM